MDRAAANNFGYGQHQVGDDGLIDRLPCRGCGEPTLSTLQVDINGTPHHWVYLCRPCKAKHAVARAVRRIVFDGLISDGWSNEDANRLMIQSFGRTVTKPVYTLPRPRAA